MLGCIVWSTLLQIDACLASSEHGPTNCSSKLSFGVGPPLQRIITSFGPHEGKANELDVVEYRLLLDTAPLLALLTSGRKDISSIVHHAKSGVALILPGESY